MWCRKGSRRVGFDRRCLPGSTACAARFLGSEVAVGSCATGARESGQARDGAAFIGIAGVPQIAWPSPHSPRTVTSQYGGRYGSVGDSRPSVRRNGAPDRVGHGHDREQCRGADSRRILHPIWEWDGETLTRLRNATSPLSSQSQAPGTHADDVVDVLAARTRTRAQSVAAPRGTTSQAGHEALWARYSEAPDPLGYVPSLVPAWTSPRGPGLRRARTRASRHPSP